MSIVAPVGIFVFHFAIRFVLDKPFASACRLHGNSLDDECRSGYLLPTPLVPWQTGKPEQK